MQHINSENNNSSHNRTNSNKNNNNNSINDLVNNSNSGAVLFHDDQPPILDLEHGQQQQQQDPPTVSFTSCPKDQCNHLSLYVVHEKKLRFNVNLTTSTAVLVVWKVGTGKHEEAKKHGIPCVNEEWIVDCDFNRINDFPVRAFEGVYFCSTGFLNYNKIQEHNDLKLFIERNGGKMSDQLSLSVDCLVYTENVLSEAENKKMNFAKERDIRTVKFEDFIVNGLNYSPQDIISAGSTAAQRKAPSTRNSVVTRLRFSKSRTMSKSKENVVGNNSNNNNNGNSIVNNNSVNEGNGNNNNNNNNGAMPNFYNNNPEHVEQVQKSNYFFLPAFSAQEKAALQEKKRPQQNQNSAANNENGGKYNPSLQSVLNLSNEDAAPVSSSSSTNTNNNQFVSLATAHTTPPVNPSEPVVLFLPPSAAARKENLIRSMVSSGLFRRIPIFNDTITHIVIINEEPVTNPDGTHNSTTSSSSNNINNNNARAATTATTISVYKNYFNFLPDADKRGSIGQDDIKVMKDVPYPLPPHIHVVGFEWAIDCRRASRVVEPQLYRVLPITLPVVVLCGMPTIERRNKIKNDIVLQLGGIVQTRFAVGLDVNVLRQKAKDPTAIFPSHLVCRCPPEFRELVNAVSLQYNLVPPSLLLDLQQEIQENDFVKNNNNNGSNQNSSLASSSINRNGFTSQLATARKYLDEFDKLCLIHDKVLLLAIKLSDDQTKRANAQRQLLQLEERRRANSSNITSEAFNAEQALLRRAVVSPALRCAFVGDDWITECVKEQQWVCSAPFVVPLPKFWKPTRVQAAIAWLNQNTTGTVGAQQGMLLRKKKLDQLQLRPTAEAMWKELHDEMQLDGAMVAHLLARGVKQQEAAAIRRAISGDVVASELNNQNIGNSNNNNVKSNSISNPPVNQNSTNNHNNANGMSLHENAAPLSNNNNDNNNNNNNNSAGVSPGGRKGGSSLNNSSGRLSLMRLPKFTASQGATSSEENDTTSNPQNEVRADDDDDGTKIPITIQSNNNKSRTTTASMFSPVDNNVENNNRNNSATIVNANSTSAKKKQNNGHVQQQRQQDSHCPEPLGDDDELKNATSNLNNDSTISNHSCSSDRTLTNNNQNASSSSSLSFSRSIDNTKNRDQHQDAATAENILSRSSTNNIEFEEEEAEDVLFQQRKSPQHHPKFQQQQHNHSNNYFQSQFQSGNNNNNFPFSSINIDFSLQNQMQQQNHLELDRMLFQTQIQNGRSDISENINGDDCNHLLGNNQFSTSSSFSVLTENSSNHSSDLMSTGDSQRNNGNKNNNNVLRYQHHSSNIALFTQMNNDVGNNNNNKNNSLFESQNMNHHRNSSSSSSSSNNTSTNRHQQSGMFDLMMRDSQQQSKSGRNSQGVMFRNDNKNCNDVDEEDEDNDFDENQQDNDNDSERRDQNATNKNDYHNSACSQMVGFNHRHQQMRSGNSNLLQQIYSTTSSLTEPSMSRGRTASDMGRSLKSSAPTALKKTNSWKTADGISSAPVIDVDDDDGVPLDSGLMNTLLAQNFASAFAASKKIFWILRADFGKDEVEEYRKMIEHHGGLMLLPSLPVGNSTSSATASSTSQHQLFLQQHQQPNHLCTHIVAKLPTRIETIISAIATGRWLLKPEFLTDSKVNGFFPSNEEGYEWTREAFTNAFRMHKQQQQQQGAKNGSGDSNSTNNNGAKNNSNKSVATISPDEASLALIDAARFQRLRQTMGNNMLYPSLLEKASLYYDIANGVKNNNSSPLLASSSSSRIGQLLQYGSPNPEDALIRQFRPFYGWRPLLIRGAEKKNGFVKSFQNILRVGGSDIQPFVIDSWNDLLSQHAGNSSEDDANSMEAVANNNTNNNVKAFASSSDDLVPLRSVGEIFLKKHKITHILSSENFTDALSSSSSSSSGDGSSSSAFQLNKLKQILRDRSNELNEEAAAIRAIEEQQQRAQHQQLVAQFVVKHSSSNSNAKTGISSRTKDAMEAALSVPVPPHRTNWLRVFKIEKIVDWLGSMKLHKNVEAVETWYQKHQFTSVTETVRPRD